MKELIEIHRKIKTKKEKEIEWTNETETRQVFGTSSNIHMDVTKNRLKCLILKMTREIQLTEEDERSEEENEEKEPIERMGVIDTFLDEENELDKKEIARKIQEAGEEGNKGKVQQELFELHIKEPMRKGNYVVALVHALVIFSVIDAEKKKECIEYCSRNHVELRSKYNLILKITIGIMKEIQSKKAMLLATWVLYIMVKGYKAVPTNTKGCLYHIMESFEINSEHIKCMEHSLNFNLIANNYLKVKTFHRPYIQKVWKFEKTLSHLGGCHGGNSANLKTVPSTTIKNSRIHHFPLYDDALMGPLYFAIGKYFLHMKRKVYSYRNFYFSSILGYMEAYYFLGMCYQHGIGTVKDSSACAFWFHEASKYQHRNAINDLGYILETGYRRTRQALKHYFHASLLGHRRALTNMAAMYREGKGTFHNNNKCWQITQMAVQKKIPRAFTQLGLIHEDGIGVESTIELALENYIRGGNLGDPDGFHNAGVLYAKNEEFQNYCSALYYFTKCQKLNGSSYKKDVVMWCSNMILKQYSCNPQL